MKSGGAPYAQSYGISNMSADEYAKTGESITHNFPKDVAYDQNNGTAGTIENQQQMNLGQHLTPGYFMHERQDQDGMEQDPNGNFTRNL